MNIKNDKQLAIAKRKRQELLDSCAPLEDEDAEVYRELARDIQRDIENYVSVRDGHVNLFAVTSVDALAESAVAARIARGLTQKQLAALLGTTEQNVQKDEARDYEHVGFARLAEVLDALGYGLVGTLRPVYLPRSEWRGPTGMRVGPPVTSVEPAGSSARHVTAGEISGWPVHASEGQFRVGPARVEGLVTTQAELSSGPGPGRWVPSL